MLNTATTDKTLRKGFTLVELSIVLVILGLLVGGTLAGQALIRSAELRSIITDKDKYATAVFAFKDKYFALPGDMPNAYAYWSTKGLAGCVSNTNESDGGCNGNGDGKIDLGPDADSYNEMLKSAMHLGFAGLVEGSYNGAGWGFDDTNTIKAKFPQSYWEIHNNNMFGIATTATYSVGTFAVGIPGRVIITLMSNTTNSLPNLSHGEAWQVDQKMDDGSANTGTLRGRRTDGTCYDRNTDGNAANGDEDKYSVVSTGADYKGDCNLFFIVAQ